MPRTVRQGADGGVYHVGTRGNDRQQIFVNAGDRYAFLNHLETAVRKSHWTLHAYCLMGNHYHLLLEAELDDLSNGMRRLNGSYAVTFNKRHHRTGHVFGNRFWSEAIGRDEQLLECSRYIAWNPVRAGLCRRPEDWPWASYRAVIGIDRTPSFLNVERTLILFAGDRTRATRRLRSFVDRL